MLRFKMQKSSNVFRLEDLHEQLIYGQVGSKIQKKFVPRLYNDYQRKFFLVTLQKLCKLHKYLPYSTLIKKGDPPSNTSSSDFYDQNFSGLIFLDVDNTIVKCEDFNNQRKDLYDFVVEPESFKNKKGGVFVDGHKNVRKFGGSFRNHVMYFLKKCFKMNIKIVIFSAGNQQYVNEILRVILDRVASEGIVSTEEMKKLKEEKKFFICEHVLHHRNCSLADEKQEVTKKVNRDVDSGYIPKELSENVIAHETKNSFFKIYKDISQYTSNMKRTFIIDDNIIFCHKNFANSIVVRDVWDKVFNIDREFKDISDSLEGIFGHKDVREPLLLRYINLIKFAITFRANNFAHSFYDLTETYRRGIYEGELFYNRRKQTKIGELTLNLDRQSLDVMRSSMRSSYIELILAFERELYSYVGKDFMLSYYVPYGYDYVRKKVHMESNENFGAVIKRNFSKEIVENLSVDDFYVYDVCNNKMVYFFNEIEVHKEYYFITKKHLGALDMRYRQFDISYYDGQRQLVTVKVNNVFFKSLENIRYIYNLADRLKFYEEIDFEIIEVKNFAHFKNGMRYFALTKHEYKFFAKKKHNQAKGMVRIDRTGIPGNYKVRARGRTVSKESMPISLDKNGKQILKPSKITMIRENNERESDSESDSEEGYSDSDDYGSEYEREEDVKEVKKSKIEKKMVQLFPSPYVRRKSNDERMRRKMLYLEYKRKRGREREQKMHKIDLDTSEFFRRRFSLQDLQMVDSNPELPSQPPEIPEAFKIVPNNPHKTSLPPIPKDVSYEEVTSFRKEVKATEKKRLGGKLKFKYKKMLVKKKMEAVLEKRMEKKKEQEKRNLMRKKAIEKKLLDDILKREERRKRKNERDVKKGREEMRIMNWLNEQKMEKRNEKRKRKKEMKNEKENEYITPEVDYSIISKPLPPGMQNEREIIAKKMNELKKLNKVKENLSMIEKRKPPPPQEFISVKDMPPTINSNMEEKEKENPKLEIVSIPGLANDVLINISSKNFKSIEDVLEPEPQKQNSRKRSRELLTEFPLRENLKKKRKLE